MYHIFFIQSSVNRYLSCFHILATVNSAAMNMGGQIRLWDLESNFLDIYPEVPLLSCMVILFLIFWGASISFFIVAVVLNSPTNNVQKFHFSTILPILVIFVVFFFFLDNSLLKRCEVIIHCGLICICLIINDIEHLFIILVIWMTSLEKQLFTFFAHFKNWVIFFLLLSCRSPLYVLDCIYLLVYANISFGYV